MPQPTMPQPTVPQPPVSVRRRALLATTSGVLLLVLGLGACGGGDDDTNEATASTEATVATETTAPAETTAGVEGTGAESSGPAAAGTDEAAACPAADGSSAPRRSFPAPPPDCLEAGKTYRAVIETTKGRIVVALDAAKAPKTVNNFVFLARYHYFDGVSFHRVVPGFVIQGGDPDGTGMGGPGYEFADELPRAGEYQIGSLAMANAGPNTNGSQFFIITGAQGAALPPNYSLFGQVVEGQDVVAAIDALGVGDGPPSEPVSMKTVTIDAP